MYVICIFVYYFNVFSCNNVKLYDNWQPYITWYNSLFITLLYVYFYEKRPSFSGKFN